MKTSTKVLLTALCVGALGSLAAMGVFGAFSSTTTNAGNTITAGTVAIADNDAGAAMYSLTAAKPGESVSKCIKVTYTGSLDADVHIYTTSTIGSLGQYVELTITPGTQTTPSFPSCTGFVRRLRRRALHGHAAELRHDQKQLRQRRRRLPRHRHQMGDQ